LGQNAILSRGEVRGITGANVVEIGAIGGNGTRKSATERVEVKIVKELLDFILGIDLELR